MKKLFYPQMWDSAIQNININIMPNVASNPKVKTMFVRRVLFDFIL